MENVTVRVYHQKGGAMGAKRYFWLKLMGDFLTKQKSDLSKKHQTEKS